MRLGNRKLEDIIQGNLDSKVKDRDGIIQIDSEGIITDRFKPITMCSNRHKFVKSEAPFGLAYLPVDYRPVDIKPALLKSIDRYKIDYEIFNVATLKSIHFDSCKLAQASNYKEMKVYLSRSISSNKREVIITKNRIDEMIKESIKVKDNVDTNIHPIVSNRITSNVLVNRRSFS